MSTNNTSKFTSMSPQLVVADIEKSISFYTTKLGFELAFRYENFYVGIVKDGFSIHLKSGRPSTGERVKKIHNEDVDILFGVTGVDALYNEYVGKKIKVIQPISDRPYGREFYIGDPDGYILAFLESPSEKI